MAILASWLPAAEASAFTVTGGEALMSAAMDAQRRCRRSPPCGCMGVRTSLLTGDVAAIGHEVRLVFSHGFPASKEVTTI